MSNLSLATAAASLLVVEDEAIVALDLESNLCEIGYSVYGTADNGRAAIAMARHNKPDLVLMDINLKGDMDGIAAAEEIAGAMRIPVVFLTSFSDSATVERAVRTAPYGYVTKPFQIKELRAVIEVALYKSTLERRLRDSEQWFTSMLHCVGDAVIATDAQGRVRFTNPASEAVTGWSLAEMEGQPFDRFLTLKDRQDGETLESPIKRALRDGRVIGIEYGSHLVTRDGSLVAVDDSVAPIRDEKGDTVGAVMVFRDVSQRLETEQALRDSERNFRHMFEFAPLGMALVSLDGKILQANRAVCKMLGYEENELVQLNDYLLSHAEDAGKERGYLFQLLTETAASVQFEKCYLAKSGESIRTLNSVSLLRRNGEPLFYLYQIHSREMELRAWLAMATKRD